MAVSGQRTPRPLYPGQRVPDITRRAGRFGEEKTLCQPGLEARRYTDRAVAVD